MQSTKLVKSESAVLSFARKILNEEAAAIQLQANNLDDRFFNAINCILSCSGNIIVIGIGKAGLIGQKMVATLASTGTPAHFVHPSEAIHGDLGRINKNDTAIILSQSGETEEITRILPSIRHFNIPVIAITSSTENTLAQFAQIVIPIGKLTEADSLKLAPSSSTAAMLALGDALALAVSELRGFNSNDFAKFHPGGALGRKLSLVDDYIRNIEQCRIVSYNETIREVFIKHSITGRRSGAILITNESGKLVGIFTDSDLARLFEQHNEHKLDYKINDVMTTSPTSVLTGTKMFDAIALMAKRKISELPVVTNDNIPLGLIDITDVVGIIPESNTIWKQYQIQTEKLNAA
ncbi:MAG: KpsF/GutQ family sugar-phosphate isomerase [Planctomycetaceae bacterium]|jgi:arabinose-5-phosphate isomerase|nr:KpsF/GutQ family sugar-phosphate isomerase [Planctomycetaceae bacterium]